MNVCIYIVHMYHPPPIHLHSLHTHTHNSNAVYPFPNSHTHTAYMYMYPQPPHTVQCKYMYIHVVHVHTLLYDYVFYVQHEYYLLYMYMTLYNAHACMSNSYFTLESCIQFLQLSDLPLKLIQSVFNTQVSVTTCRNCVEYIMYSGTSLFQTPQGQLKVF